MPAGRLVWLGLDFEPTKRNAIRVNSNALPDEDAFSGLAGLDVVVLYYGNQTRYGTIRGLCDRVGSRRPRRLQLIDLDAKRIAFLKTVAQ